MTLIPTSSTTGGKATVEMAEPRRLLDLASHGHRFGAVTHSLNLIVGVAAVVLALAVSHSASELVKGPVDGLDRNVVVVEGTAGSSSGVEAGFASRSLTRDDLVALGNAGFVPDGQAVAPTAGLRADAHSLDRVQQTDVIGSNDAFASVRGYSIATGRFLTPLDVQVGAPVVVLGQTVVNSLFAGADPVGRIVTISNQGFQVVGTLRARGFSGTYDQDDLVVTPMTAAWQLLLVNQDSPIDQVLIRAASPSRAVMAAREASATLLQRHKIVNPAQADFTVRTHRDLAARRIRTALAVKRILELVGAAFLLAGLVHLAAVQRYRAEIPGHVMQTADNAMTILAGALVNGLVGAVLGVVVAVISVPFIHRLAANLPGASVTFFGAVTGGAVGVAAAGFSVVATIFHRADVAVVPASHREAGTDRRTVSVPAVTVSNETRPPVPSVEIRIPVDTMAIEVHVASTMPDSGTPSEVSPTTKAFWVADLWVTTLKGAALRKIDLRLRGLLQTHLRERHRLGEHKRVKRQLTIRRVKQTAVPRRLTTSRDSNGTSSERVSGDSPTVRTPDDQNRVSK